MSKFQKKLFDGSDFKKSKNWIKKEEEKNLDIS